MNDATANFTADDDYTFLAEESELVYGSASASFLNGFEGEHTSQTEYSLKSTSAEDANSGATTAHFDVLPPIAQEAIMASNTELFYIVTTPFDMNLPASADSSGSVVHLTRGMLIQAEYNHGATANTGSTTWLLTEVTLHGGPTPVWLSSLTTFIQGSNAQLRELDSFTVSCLLPIDATARNLDALSPVVEFLRSAPILDGPVHDVDDAASHIVRLRTRSDALFRCNRVPMNDGGRSYTMLIVRNLANDDDQDLCTVADLVLLRNSIDLSFTSEPSTSTATPGCFQYKTNSAYGGPCTCRPVDLTDADNSFFAIGDRVSVSLPSTFGTSAKSQLATIKWMGRIVGCHYYSANQLLVGLELDKPAGTCRGEFHGFVLFEARAKHGLLVETSHISALYDDWNAPLGQPYASSSASASASAGPDEPVPLPTVGSLAKHSAASQPSGKSASASKRVSTSAQKSALPTKDQGNGETSKSSRDRKRRQNQNQLAANESNKVPRVNSVMKAATQSALAKLMTTNPVFESIVNEALGTSTPVVASKSSAGASLAVVTATATGAGMETSANSCAGSSDTKMTEKAELRIELHDTADCKLCFAASKNALFQPCCHLAFCFDCASQLQRSRQPCPICRKPIFSVLRVYDA